MPAIDSNQVVIKSIHLTEQTVTPATPPTGGWKIFSKADGLYLVDDAGTVTGPIGGGTPTFVGAKATRVTTQSIPNATWTAVTFTGEDYDSNAFHDNSTNPSRFTVPAGKTGYYTLKFLVSWDVAGAGDRYMAFRVNGGTVTGTVAGFYRTSIYFNQGAAIDLHLTAGDYVEMMVYQDYGGALDVRTASASIAMLGA